MSNSKLLEQFLLSRFPKRIYSMTYLKSVPHELYLELTKFYLNDSDCSYEIRLDPGIQDHIEMRDRYMKCCIPIKKISNDLLSAIIDNKSFYDNMTFAYGDNMIKVYFQNFGQSMCVIEHYDWYMTYNLFNCLLEVVSMVKNKKD